MLFSRARSTLIDPVPFRFLTRSVHCIPSLSPPVSPPSLAPLPDAAPTTPDSSDGMSSGSTSAGVFSDVSSPGSSPGPCDSDPMQDSLLDVEDGSSFFTALGGDHIPVTQGVMATAPSQHGTKRGNKRSRPSPSAHLMEDPLDLPDPIVRHPDAGLSFSGHSSEDMPTDMPTGMAVEDMSLSQSLPFLGVVSRTSSGEQSDNSVGSASSAASFASSSSSSSSASSFTSASTSSGFHPGCVGAPSSSAPSPPAGPPLSAEAARKAEQKRKKEERLRKNREAADRSRRKRKLADKNLKQHVVIIEEQNKLLQARVTHGEARVRELEAKLATQGKLLQSKADEIKQQYVQIETLHSVLARVAQGVGVMPKHGGGPAAKLASSASSSSSSSLSSLSLPISVAPSSPSDNMEGAEGTKKAGGAMVLALVLCFSLMAGGGDVPYGDAPAAAGLGYGAGSNGIDDMATAAAGNGMGASHGGGGGAMGATGWLIQAGGVESSGTMSMVVGVMRAITGPGAGATGGVGGVGGVVFVMSMVLMSILAGAYMVCEYRYKTLGAGDKAARGGAGGVLSFLSGDVMRREGAGEVAGVKTVPAPLLPLHRAAAAPAKADAKTAGRSLPE